MSLSYVLCRNACTYVSTLKQVPKTVRVKLQINILNDRLVVGGAFMFVCRFCLQVIKSKQGLGMRKAKQCYSQGFEK